MKCKDCACYKNEWCSMVTDSPDPDMDRDCGHFIRAQRWIPVTERLPEKQRMCLRLASIEDILGDEYDLDELREMVQAKRDGRCVVLPCKIDDDVYINLFGRTLDATVISISELASTPTYKAMYGIRLCYIFKADDVGRTVFLTREAAEEALKAREQE